jgi:hypothetical protein
MATINKEPKDNSAAQAVVASIFSSNEVAVQQEKELAVFGAEVFDDFDSDIVTTSSDFIVPRLKLMQAGSDDVKEGRALMREYRSNTGVVLAKPDEPLEVIVFKRDKFWMISEVTADGKKVEGGLFRREDFTLANQSAQYRFTEEGKNLQRTLVYDFFLIKASEDPAEILKSMPVIFSLSSTSSKVARDWYTKFTLLKTEGKNPVSHVFVLGSYLEKKNGNSWFIPTVSLGRATTKEEQESAIFWRLSFQNRDIKVHEETGDQA